MSDALPEQKREMFPRLSASQIARLLALGHRRRVAAGEILIEQGAFSPEFFVVLSGEVVIVQPAVGQDVRLALLGEGQFTGEAALVSGRANVVRVRALTDGEVVA